MFNTAMSPEASCNLPLLKTIEAAIADSRKNPRNGYLDDAINVFDAIKSMIRPVDGPYEFEAMVGDHILSVAEKAVRLVAAGHPSVVFDFNETRMTVTSGMTANDVCNEFGRIRAEAQAAYEATPEYKESRLRAEEAGRQRAIEFNKAMKRAPSSMTLSDEGLWATLLKNNDDPMGKAISSFANRWACFMEMMIAEGSAVAECADRASSLADSEGISGSMWSFAYSSLVRVWIHGKELEAWHRK